MNEPVFYTPDSVPFTAADPDYQEKYQYFFWKRGFFPDCEENGTDLSRASDPYWDDIDDEMGPEIEEAYEKFCLESEHKRKVYKVKFQFISFIKQCRHCDLAGHWKAWKSLTKLRMLRHVTNVCKFSFNTIW